MKFQSIILISLLFVFTNKLLAQPPNANISSDCPKLQNVNITINASANTFSLDYTPSSTYMVWDLHQETAAGDIIVNFGASDIANFSEPLNSDPNDGEYYIKVWNVCSGDGTYDGAETISEDVSARPKITVIDDEIIGYIGGTPEEFCEGLDNVLVYNLCETTRDFSKIEYIIFGCEETSKQHKEGDPNVIKIAKGEFGQSVVGFSSEDPDPNSFEFLGNSFMVGNKDWFYSKICNRNIISQKTNNNTTLSPNPTTGDLTINLNLPTSTALDIRVLNIQGQMVKVLSNQEKTNRGKYQSTFDVSELHAGLYFLEIMTNEGKSTTKFMKN